MSTSLKVFLVLLRIAIGWHFLYEGVFKIQSDQTGQPLVASRYFLQASTARLRDSFSEARIDQWHDEIVRYFKNQGNDLSEEQKARLLALRDQLKADGNADIDWAYVHDEVLKLSAPKPPQYFTSQEFLQASVGPFRGLFRGLVADIDGVERLTVEAAQARIDRRYHEILRHYAQFTPDQKARLAAARDSIKKSVAATLNDPQFRARLADYKIMLERVRQDARRTDAAFSRERLDNDRKRLNTIAGELLAFVNEPLTELQAQAQSLATVAQMQAGPPPRAPEQTGLLDWTVKWGLTAIGLCLMLGLFTRVAAVGAALQLLMFYLAWPP